ncbi:hypothetical protein LshimejAT787_0501550 [Lyophyllum shimeji]|uniref:Uncharacterized protein n=1 Tax=Lyophyllum shimeji TaxID=47721 RepID=A0A9P3UNV1_LYOSH|nr:hypothetical protein LshimejAT787_0501550 [Lyophyllum shimeji]
MTPKTVWMSTLASRRSPEWGFRLGPPAPHSALSCLIAHSLNMARSKSGFGEILPFKFLRLRLRLSTTVTFMREYVLNSGPSSSGRIAGLH